MPQVALSQEKGKGFLLLDELEGFKSLQDWLSDPDIIDNKVLLDRITDCVADMISSMHSCGFVHMDLYSWHIFLKEDGDSFICQPIDLERTTQKGKWPWSN